MVRGEKTGNSSKGGPPKRRRRKTSWVLLGGEWPHRLDGLLPEAQLHYAVLRSALQVLVDNKDGVKLTGADAVSTARHYWAARTWIFKDISAATLSCADCCIIFDLDIKELRKWLRVGGF